MAKAIALIASALCFLAVAAHAHDHKFTIEGSVYCDGCKVLFPTGCGGKIGQAVVELQCRCRENGTITATISSKADNGGRYAISVDKDHENDICEVKVVSSPVPHCNIIAPEISRARVSLAKNSGIITNSRFANPIGFVRTKALPECLDVLDSMGFIPQI